MSTMPKVWDDDVVQRYLTPESHQKSREEFIDTHIDIDKIHAEYLYPHEGTDEFVNQEEFRDAILKSSIDDDNRIFILKGETGSGKSQLCQWLEYQIGTVDQPGIAGDDEHIALHVSRSKTRISDILEILTEPLEENADTASSVEDLDPVRVADAIVTTLDAFAPSSESLEKEDLRALIKERPKTQDFRDILIDNIKAYQKAVISDEEVEIPDLLDEDDYKNLAFHAFGSARGGDTIFPALRDKIHEILSQNLGVSDFKGKLEELSEEYAKQGLRPVLICEDLTTFSVLKEQLLDHIFQLDSGHYDVVLGWTTGWEQDQLDRALSASDDTYTYMKDRAEGYLSTTDEQGRAYFLNEDVTVELARKYMEVIRAKSGKNTDVDIPDDDFESLYPFNSSFIRRAYDNLVQDGVERRTPRLLLIRIIKECLNSPVPPHEAVNGNPYVKKFPSNIKLEYPEEHKELAKWYGSATISGKIGVPAGIPETFDIGVPEEYLQDEMVIYDSTIDDLPTLQVSHYRGTIEPGETITLQTTVDKVPESGVEITVDGTVVGETGSNGQLEIMLPDTSKEVELTAEKSSLKDTLSFDLAHDTFSIEKDREVAVPHEELTLHTLLNGDPVSGVEIYFDDEPVATSNDQGMAAVTIPDGVDSVKYGAEYEGISTSATIPIQKTEEQNWPVETSLSDDEVNQRRFEYEQWITEGVEYESASTLIDGVVNVLNRWHDPTRLSNHNSIATGVYGIYYDRGTEIPIGLQGAKEPSGVSLDLPFGSELNDLYEPMFWCGISDDGQLPDETQYDIDYGALKSWTDDQVATYRQSMREDIESCLTDEMTIEELIVFAQFLLHNASRGVTEVSVEKTLQGYNAKTDYDSPIRKHFDELSGFKEAYNELTQNSQVPHQLAEGFFQLKDGFIDYDRIQQAVDSVDENLESYMTKAMQIDTADFPTAYRVKTSRSAGSSTDFGSFLERIRQYVVELNDLTAGDAPHIQDSVVTVSKWFESGVDDEEVVTQYARLYDYIDITDVASKEDMVTWEKQKNQLKRGEQTLKSNVLRRDLDYFANITELEGFELLAALHEFEKSTKEISAWSVFENISEMIKQLEDLDIDEEDDGFTDRIRESSEYSTYEALRRDIEKTNEGI